MQPIIHSLSVFQPYISEEGHYPSFLGHLHAVMTGHGYSFSWYNTDSIEDFLTLQYAVSANEYLYTFQRPVSSKLSRRTVIVITSAPPGAFDYHFGSMLGLSHLAVPCATVEL